MARDAEAAMAKTTAIRVIANLVRLEVLVWRRMEFMKASPGKTKNSFASRIPIRASVFWHGPLANLAETTANERRLSPELGLG